MLNVDSGFVCEMLLFTGRKMENGAENWKSFGLCHYAFCAKVCRAGSETGTARSEASQPPQHLASMQSRCAKHSARSTATIIIKSREEAIDLHCSRRTI
eukprot:scaffold1345_cov173-Ochromonas_danica.AAC.3